MSRPRPIIEHSALMITRRVRGRQFLLKPTPLVTQLITYVVAVMAERHDIVFHAVCVLSNHYHLCCSDPKGNIVRFTHDAHQLIARYLNARRGDFENVWNTSQTSHVRLEQPADVVRKISYTLANPVEARLVRFGHHWPGLRRRWPAPPRTVRRPPEFFRGSDQGGTFPESAVLEFHRPPGFDDLTDDELAAHIKKAAVEREERFRKKADAEGKPFLGRKAILRQSCYDRPSSRAPHFGISPSVACQDKWRRIERLARNRQWQMDYQNCRHRWKGGERGIRFPYGTYQLRIDAGVRCRPPPDN